MKILENLINRKKGPIWRIKHLPFPYLFTEEEDFIKGPVLLWLLKNVKWAYDTIVALMVIDFLINRL